MSRGPAVYICGGDETPGPRGTDCPDPLHDHPLPIGYADACGVAYQRLDEGWHNRQCVRCGLFGWAPPERVTCTAGCGRQVSLATYKRHKSKGCPAAAA